MKMYFLDLYVNRCELHSRRFIYTARKSIENGIARFYHVDFETSFPQS